MDDRRFDAVTRTFARSGSRRTLFKGLLGVGGAAAAGAILLEPHTNAARRPTPTPRPVTCPGNQVPCGTDCCCPDGSAKCGPDCCPNGQAECCDNACCYGTCYGEELCCPTGLPVCIVDGCCDGQCVGGGQFCCAVSNVCGDDCCGGAERCCGDAAGNPVCVPAGNCCSDEECGGGRCIGGHCATYTPTNTPTAIPSNTPTNTPTTIPSNTPTNTPTTIPSNTPTNTPTTIPSNTPTNTPTTRPQAVTLSLRRDLIDAGQCVVTITVTAFTPNSGVEPTYSTRDANGTYGPFVGFGVATNASGDGTDPDWLLLGNCPNFEIQANVNGVLSAWVPTTCPGPPGNCSQ